MYAAFLEKLLPKIHLFDHDFYRQKLDQPDIFVEAVEVIFETHADLKCVVVVPRLELFQQKQDVPRKMADFFEFISWLLNLSKEELNYA